MLSALSFECRVFVRVVGVDRDDGLVVPLLDLHPLARCPRARRSAPLANDRLAVHSVWSSARGPVHPFSPISSVVSVVLLSHSVAYDVVCLLPLSSSIDVTLPHALSKWCRVGACVGSVFLLL